MRACACVRVCARACKLLYPLFRSVEPLFESSRLDDNLRALVKRTFPELVQQGMCMFIHVYIYIYIYTIYIYRIGNKKRHKERNYVQCTYVYMILL